MLCADQNNVRAELDALRHSHWDHGSWRALSTPPGLEAPSADPCCFDLGSTQRCGSVSHCNAKLLLYSVHSKNISSILAVKVGC